LQITSQRYQRLLHLNGTKYLVPFETKMKADILIVGGGLAGLAAANGLLDAEHDAAVVEAADRLGGRVHTERIDGFALDRGFQVLLTAYPDARCNFDYDDLQLGTFYPGALVFKDGTGHRLGDPFRHFIDGLQTAFQPIGTLADKLRVGRLRADLVNTDLDELARRPNISTQRALRESYGFSDEFIREFFEPFVGGITLDASLQTSRRFFDFVFRMFSTGHAALPAGGMDQLVDQLRDPLPDDNVGTGRRVRDLNRRDGDVIVTYEDGATSHHRAVILAIPPWDLRDVLGDESGDWSERPHQRVTSMYFRAPQSPLDDNMLVLDGEREGPINNLAVPSDIADEYAPAGESLISVTILDADDRPRSELTRSVRRQATDWFGPEVQAWEHLETFHIDRALPTQTPEYMETIHRPVHLDDRVFLAGDHRETSSIQGALSSGRRAAAELDAILS